MVDARADPEARERHMKHAGMQDVTWNSVSAFRPDEPSIEFSLRTQCGAVLRFRMPKDGADVFAVSLAEALQDRSLVQALMSEGIPRAEGSPIAGHVQVPVAAASAAD